MTKEPEKMARYDYLVDPSDCYLIWDCATDLPCFDGCILAFATKDEALEALSVLNGRKELAANADPRHSA